MAQQASSRRAESADCETGLLLQQTGSGLEDSHPLPDLNLQEPMEKQKLFQQTEQQHRDGIPPPPPPPQHAGVNACFWLQQSKLGACSCLLLSASTPRSAFPLVCGLNPCQTLFNICSKCLHSLWLQNAPPIVAKVINWIGVACPWQCSEAMQRVWSK